MKYNLYIFLFFIMFAIMMKQQLDNTELSNINENNISKIDSLSSNSSALDKENNRKYQLNLVIRSYVKGREERKLKADTNYLNLLR